MSEIENYLRVKTIEDALACLQQPASRIIAGGTDLLLKAPSLPNGALTVVDISGVEELSGVWTEKDGVRIGAATRLADVARAGALHQGAFKALCQGASQVGSPQIRNLGTLGGNLCNAAPSADTAAPLLSLDACAEIASAHGRRSLPLTEFFKGPGKTSLVAGEMLTAIFIPNPLENAGAVYLKHSPRKAMDLAVVGVAVLLVSEGVRRARVALGAVAPTPLRSHSAEQYLEQVQTLDEAAADEAARLAAETAHPISDVRASLEYRREMVKALTRRAVRQLCGL